MNSMFSALKPKKNSNNSNGCNGIASTEKHNGAAVGSTHSAKKKAAISAQEGGYQYLRHIREIEGATKMLSPIAAVSDDCNFRATLVTPPQCMDVVDHAMTVRLTPTADDCLAEEATAATAGVTASDCNMNGSKYANSNGLCLYNTYENGNCSSNMCEPLANLNGQSNVSPTHQLGAAEADDESEHSAAACNSSSSEHSNSTVVLSPSETIDCTPNLTTSSSSNSASPLLTVPAALQHCSPSKSLSSQSLSSCSSISIALCNSGPSSCSSSTSCDVTAIAASPVATCSSSNSVSSPSSPTAIVNSSSCSDEYVPAFLSSAPVTLPIIMPNGSSSLSTVPSYQNGNSMGLGSGCGSTPVNSAANTPKHSRYSKPRLSLSRFVNNSMPSVHGRPNLSLACGGGLNSMGGAAAATNSSNPPKRISTHQRNLSLDFR